MQAVLFDLDGVLIDTETQYSLFWQNIGKLYFPQQLDFAASIKGQSLKQIFDEHFAHQAAAQNDICQRLEAFERDMAYPYFPGTRELAAQLRSKAIPTAIVTSSNQAKMERVYEEHPELPTWFDRIFTAEDSSRSKPAPDCYLHAAQALGVSPQRCLVVEDSLNGLRAGRAAGAITLGIASSLSCAELTPFANLVYEHLADIDWEAVLQRFL